MKSDLYQYQVEAYVESVCLAHPNEDISGTWTPSVGGDMFAVIDELQIDDTDYIESVGSPTSQSAEVALEDCPDPERNDGHIVRYRYQRGQGTDPVDLTVLLLDASTTIATFTHTNIGDSVVEAIQSLTAAEADNISDYSNLRLRFTANAP